MLGFVSWRVEVSHVEKWLDSLSQDDYDQVMAALELLEERGPTLGRPLVDSIKGSQHKNMKELRPSSGGRSAIRILFAFDPKRQAIMLVAGDKQNQWKQWYTKNVPLADAIFEKHIRSLK